MAEIEDGGPAFATGNPEQGGHAGMTLRDYFAGQALTGLLSDVYLQRAYSEALPDSFATLDQTNASFAYVLADAMLAARKP